jgi:hypothetical protein
MRYEFEAIEKFVDSSLLLYGQKRHLKPGEFEEKKKFITSEVERLKTLLITQPLAIESERLLELFIQHHQLRVVQMVDRISRRCDPATLWAIDKPDSQMSMVKLSFKKLEELLTFIETHFSKYFDVDQKIPDAYSFLEKRSLRVPSGVAEKKAAQHLDRELVHIAFFPFNDFTNEESEKSITYRRLIYLKALLRDIDSILQSSEPVGFFLGSFNCWSITISTLIISLSMSAK